MLRRHQQMRMQIHQWMDALVFALSFWMAYQLRANPWIVEEFSLQPVAPFSTFFWFWLVLIPVAPLILETQGFYDRPLLGPRRAMLWSLFKGCLLISVGLVIVMFFFRLY